MPPNDVTRVLHEALDNAPLVLREPAPDVLFDDFGASALIYRVRFWIDDYGKDGAARDQVRRNIWYTFKRHGIEIPYPQTTIHLRRPSAASKQRQNALDRDEPDVDDLEAA